MKKICEQCGIEYEPNKVNASRQRFCTEECCNKWHHSNGLHSYVCQNCGQEYIAKAKNRDRFCSKKCAGKYRTKNSKDYYCKGCGKYLGKFTEAQKKFSSTIYCSEDCKNKCKFRELKYKKVCEICGKEFYTASKAAKRCSLRSCQLEAARRRSQELFVSDAKPQQCMCEVCGKEFVSKTAAGAKYCEDCHTKTPAYKASKKRSAYKRRARKQNVKVERFINQEIFERDGWVCQICGKPVAKDKTCPHPKSPTLDHIIPLAKGGNHTRQNVQLAHFICNSKKSDTGPGQLRLLD